MLHRRSLTFDLLDPNGRAGTGQLRDAQGHRQEIAKRKAAALTKLQGKFSWADSPERSLIRDAHATQAARNYGRDAACCVLFKSALLHPTMPASFSSQPRHPQPQPFPMDVLGAPSS